MNFWRQLDVFDPSKFEKRVHVIGCGAIGSHVVDTLIKAGIENISVYDYDLVEDHNIPNQVFNQDHINKMKVEAMAQLAKLNGVKIDAHEKKVESIEIDGESYVILAVDSMESRKEIWDNCIKMNPDARLIETRMAAEHGIIHVVDPIDPDEVEYWEDQWFPSSEAEESACTNRAVATTAKLLSSVVVHYLMTWENGDKPPIHTMVCMRPLAVVTKDVA